MFVSGIADGCVEAEDVTEGIGEMGAGSAEEEAVPSSFEKIEDRHMEET